MHKLSIDGDQVDSIADRSSTDSIVDLIPDDPPGDSLPHNSQCTQKRLHFLYYAVVVILIQIVNALVTSFEYNFGYYLPTYLTTSVHRLDKHVSAHMASLVATAYAAGRLISILMAVKDRVQYIIYTCILMLLITNGLFFVCPAGDIGWIRFLMFAFGLSFSSLLPSMLAFIEQRVNITNSLNATMLCSATILFCINSIVIGSNVESNPQLFLYLNTAYPALFLGFFLAFHCTDLVKKRLTQR